MKGWKITLIITVGIVAAGAVALYNYCTTPYRGDDAWVYVSQNVGEEGFADSLRASLGDRLGDRVFRIWEMSGARISLARGAYCITDGEKAWEIARRFKNGQQTPIKVTFNNLRTIDELSERIASQMDFDAAEFMAACDSVLPSAGFCRETYPAAFLPDTYEFYWNAGALKTVSRLLDYRNRFWNDSRREKARAANLTPVEVATIASIVEEETVKSDERPKVARLYRNRLERGMLLQSDPTVKYAVGDFSLRRILKEHLDTDSPYNTYKYAGLPPGPIRIPAASTLDAVLDAPRHGYLYMCAKEDFSGYHNFATDFTVHQLNARRYHAELNRRGIRK